MLINTYMATVAVLVLERVTNLAGKITEVLLVLRVAFRIGPDVRVAVFALGQIRVLISGGCRLVSAMEFLAVAVSTRHTLL